VARATSVWASLPGGPARLALGRVLSLESQKQIAADRVTPWRDPGPREQRCACGCGALVTSKHYGRTRRFVDHAHGERARRARLAARVQAPGVGTDVAPSASVAPSVPTSPGQPKAARYGWSPRAGWPSEQAFAAFLADQ
jgi:hypothetical protein